MRWCQLLLLCFVTAALFAVIWFLFYQGFINRHGRDATVRMDPVEPEPSAEIVKGGFESHLQRYSDLAKLLLTLAAATVAFLVNFLANISSEGKRSIYSIRLESACASSIWFLEHLPRAPSFSCCQRITRTKRTVTHRNVTLTHLHGTRSTRR